MDKAAVLVSAMVPHRTPNNIHLWLRGDSSAMRSVSKKAKLNKNAVRLISQTTRTGQ